MNDRRRVSLKDVAREAGVSTSTVSHVLNGTRFVAQDTELRVRKAIESMGYRQNSIARMLRQSRSNCIGVLVPDISHEFYSSVVRGVEKVLYEHNYNIILSDSREMIEKERAQLDVFMSMQVDGIIFTPTRDIVPEIESSYYCGLPIVSVDRRISNAQMDSVETSGEISSFEATEYLIKQGHKRIVFATARPELYCCEVRFLGYKRALETYGIPFDPELVHIVTPTVESGRELMQWAMYHTMATAILVNNLHASVGVLQYANTMGVALPSRMAVIGFDDGIWTTVTTPPLSTITTKSEQIGMTAANMLLARLDNPNKGIENIVVRNSLVLRGTT